MMFYFSYHILYKNQYSVSSMEEGEVPGKLVVQPIDFIFPAFRAVRLEGLLESISRFNHFNTRFPLQDDPGWL